MAVRHVLGYMAKPGSDGEKLDLPLGVGASSWLRLTFTVHGYESVPGKACGASPAPVIPDEDGSARGEPESRTSEGTKSNLVFTHCQPGRCCALEVRVTRSNQRLDELARERFYRSRGLFTPSMFLVATWVYIIVVWRFL
ncbi:MAG: hypothetical protein JRJ29_13270 [Deltaproteobacteria bacterium]|nr:hypothetical protein [Deltaproteobacteria bacterium]